MYELTFGRDLVHYDATANNNAALAAAAPRLQVGGQQLAPFCHNDLQRAVLALPGSNVLIVRGRLTPNQVGSHRPSYINAILIQSREVLRKGNDACIDCRTNPNRGPFPFCHSLPWHFGGCCGNFKWRDHAARCSLVRGPVNIVDSDDSDSGADDEDGSRGNPILIKSEANDDGRRTTGRMVGYVNARGSGSAEDPYVL